LVAEEKTEKKKDKKSKKSKKAKADSESDWTKPHGSVLRGTDICLQSISSWLSVIKNVLNFNP
jgi:hypothetical protein